MCHRDRFPWQLEPAPAVQPKQCAPVTIRRPANRSQAASSKSAMLRGKSASQGESQHLIEIAVRKIPLPVHGQRRAAHQPLDVRRVERLDEQPEIRLELARLQQVVQEPVDRHVGDRKQPGEFELITGPQFAPVCGLQRPLIGRERRTGRIEHQRQYQGRIGLTVPHGVEPAQGVDRTLKDLVAALPIHVLRQITGQRGHDLNALLRQELGQVRESRRHQNRQVAAIDHAAAQARASVTSQRK